MSVSAHPFHSANDLTYSFQAQLMGSPDHKPGQRLFVALLQTCVSAAGDETKAGYYLSENDGADWKHCAGNQVPEGLRVFSTVSG
ncbi:MAG: hypothetical protein H7A21_14180 [Spirochaetales bacterium]|nr:hypothetical protein [Spirochaetales bacterium]